MIFIWFYVRWKFVQNPIENNKAVINKTHIYLVIDEGIYYFHAGVV